MTMRRVLILVALASTPLPSVAAAMNDLPARPRSARGSENCTSGDFSRTSILLNGIDSQPLERTTEALASCAAIASGSRLFLQRDPNGYEDSVNLYAGFRWDPINLRDPTGRETGYERVLN